MDTQNYSLNVSDKEYESVIALPGSKRYAYILKKVADWEEVWSLRNKDGWVLSADADGLRLVPVWPNDRYAQACIIEEWQDCKPAVIGIEAWMQRWIPGMIRDNRRVAVFPTKNDKGVVVEPSRLQSDLHEECEQYE